MYVWVTLYVRVCDSVCACVCDSVCVWSTLYVCVCVCVGLLEAQRAEGRVLLKVMRYDGAY